MTQLRNLVTFVNLPTSWEGLDPQHDLYLNTITKLVDANANSLHTLTIHGDALWTTPLSSLRSLTLIDARYLPSLAPQLALGQLTSLRLYLLDLTTPSLLLAAAPTACPHLVDLTLIYDIEGEAVNDDPMKAISEFLKNKSRLRRLHVVFYSMNLVCDRPLLNVLKDLPALEVLGMELAQYQLSKADLQMYDDSLPIGLTSLLLYVDFGEMEVTRADFAAMVRTHIPWLALCLLMINFD